MPEQLEALLTRLQAPDWAVAGALLILGVVVWYSRFDTVSPFRRAFEYHKGRLELLKLFYETEALRSKTSVEAPQSLQAPINLPHSWFVDPQPRESDFVRLRGMSVAGLLGSLSVSLVAFLPAALNDRALLAPLVLILILSCAFGAVATILLLHIKGFPHEPMASRAQWALNIMAFLESTLLFFVVLAMIS